jgi:hypothetical protein
MEEKHREEEQDQWFNQARPMVKVKHTWREKRLAREEDTENDGSSEGNDTPREGRRVEAKAESGAAGSQDACTMEVDIGVCYSIGISRARK